MKKIWLDKDIKNKDLYSPNPNHHYKSSNKYQVDKLFYKLVMYSRNNNQYYGKYNGNEENPDIEYYDGYLIDTNMIKSFVEFCYSNK